VAKAVGAYFMVDMAHYAGLIAAGVYPNPVPHADVVTSTTHKSLRGPRGGIILMNDEEIAKKINSAIFPGIQGGPLMHVIAGKAVAFKEALQPEFKAYQQQVVANARVLAETLIERGLRIVSGRTESHVMLVDLRPKGLTGKEAEAILGAGAHDLQQERHPERPAEADGHQRHPPGHPAMTTRGFKEEQAAPDGAPDRRRAGQPARRGQPRRRACQGGGADARLPGLPLTPRPAAIQRHALPLLRPRRDPGRRDARVRRGRRHPPPPPLPAVRQALHHLRAHRDRDAGGGQEGRLAGRVRPAKLRASMMLALRKRPVSVEQVDAALERIQDKLLASGAREVPSTRLGELVMRELKRIDKVAYVRFASVYRSSRTWTSSGS
jgi:hypothetical protein